MAIPIAVGDVIITYEICRSKIGCISKDRLMNGMIYELQPGFVDAAQTALAPHPSDMPLFAITQNGTLHGEKQDFDLNKSVSVAKKDMAMQWFVVEADHEKDRYSLVAIAGGRKARIQDWENIQRYLAADEIPPVSQYLYLRDIDSSFFEKKAVFRLSGEPLN